MKMIIKYIKENNLGEIYVNKTFKELTTLKIGGKIKLFFLPNTIASFLKFYDYVKDLNIPIFILGAGSNVLANDKKYRGIVISFQNLELKYILIKDTVTVYAGYRVVKLVFKMAKQNLGGIEFLAGIPGTIGGVVAMNAGAYGKSISDFLIGALCLDRNGNLIYLTNEDLKFSYRSSLVRMKDLIVLSAIIKLEKKPQEQIKTQISELLKKRKDTQPLNTKNAGCVFKNHKDFHAWYLIDQVGLRGAHIGDATISPKHANFFINKNKAKARDMLKLIKLAHKKVLNKCGISLLYEWVLLNFPKNLLK